MLSGVRCDVRCLVFDMRCGMVCGVRCFVDVVLCNVWCVVVGGGVWWCVV